MKPTIEKKGKLDYWIFFSVMILVAIGLIMIYSASPTVSLHGFGDSFYYLKKQVLYLLLGGGAFWWGYHLHLPILKKWALPGLLLSLFFLVILFIPGIGQSIGGSSRWIYLGFLSFQPSELAKLSLIIFLAVSLSNKRETLQDFLSGFLPLLMGVLIIVLLVMKQPDLGTAMVILLTSFTLFFIAGVNVGHLFSIFFLGGLGMVGYISSHLYQKQRILAFLDPWKDPQGVGFHIIQSLIAVGSGGPFGLGLGNSRQKFFYLPQQFTDFIYAILCEELGFIGAAFVVILFFTFAIRGIRVVRYTEDPFKRLLALGIVCWISFQAFINMAVVVNLIPTTGIPLSFISFGGTSLMTMLFGIGILLNISRDIMIQK